MIDIASIFKGKALDPAKLASYGFTESGGRYEIGLDIMQGAYRAAVSLSLDGDVDLRVYDLEDGGEYMPARVLHASGAFVGEIHGACGAVLRDIAEKCCSDERFKCGQTKRILRRIKETWGVEPEFLWNKFPECCALRVRGKRSWFALAVRVPREKLAPGEGGTAEVMNLKGDPDGIISLIRAGTAYPAYHMNKKHWCSIILDDALDDAAVMGMVRRSYELAGGANDA